MSRPGEADVCVVGSGASGSVVAAELASAGFGVVVLEAGEETDTANIPTARADWEHRLSDFHPSDPLIDRVSYAPDCGSFRVSRFRGVGGSTMHFEGLYTRMHPEDWRRASHTGMGTDWPLSYEQLVPFYDRVESRLGVSGIVDNPFEPPRRPYPNPPIEMSCAVKRVKTGCDKLGLSAAHAPVAILSRPRDGRGACNFCGGCWFGCMRGAISNAAQTFLPDALAHGAEIRPRCSASRIVADADGRRAQGVEYLDADGNLVLQRARIVVLAGNAIETPRLLLMSANPAHPDGLANRSGLVGRYFSIHTYATMTGWFDERVDAYKGPNVNGMVQDYWAHRDTNDFTGGYLIALRNAELGPYHHYRRRLRGKPTFGAALYEDMAATFGHTASASAFGEHFATPDDRVTLDAAARDRFGLPVPQVCVGLRDNELRMLRHMRSTLREIMEAAGAFRVETTRINPMLGTHLMGTCRMGVDPARSVVDVNGRTHDVGNLYVVDGSVFPGSTPANPTLTIQAMASRIAHGIARRGGRPVPA